MPPITPESSIHLSKPGEQTLKDATEKLQRQLVVRALEEHQGNWTRAGKALGLDHANLARLAKRFGGEGGEEARRPMRRLSTLRRGR